MKIPYGNTIIIIINFNSTLEQEVFNRLMTSQNKNKINTVFKNGGSLENKEKKKCFLSYAIFML